VATPTSKLRFAWASCSETAFFWLSASSIELGERDVEYATATRTIRSCWAELKMKSACGPAASVVGLDYVLIAEQRATLTRSLSGNCG
jgi:hypothetical protein